MVYHMQKTPRIAYKYRDMNDKLTSYDGLLLRGSRVIIPSALKESLLHDLHKEHTIIMTYQLTARTLIYWPSIKNDIEDYSSSAAAASGYHLPFLQSPCSIMTLPKDLVETWCRLYGLGWQKIFTYQVLLQIPPPFHMSSTTANAIINYLSELVALCQQWKIL